MSIRVFDTAAGENIRLILGGGTMKVRQAHGAFFWVVFVSAGPITITGRSKSRYRACFTFPAEHEESLAVRHCVKEDGSTPGEAIAALKARLEPKLKALERAINLL